MPAITIIIGGGVISAFLLIVGIIVSVSSEKSLVEQRIGRYVDNEPVNVRTGPRESPLTDWMNRKMERSSIGESISKELARADLKLKPSEYIALLIISSVAVGALAYYIGNNPIVGAVGMVIGIFIPRMYVKSQQSKRLIKFDDQLGDMANLMVNGLRAGYSTMQAMEAVSKELPPPISDEFRRVVQEMQLGINMQTALDNLLRRIPSDDLDLVVTAINVQREVGGNLAEILDTISFTIRERVRIKGEIRVLTTQVMYSGRFLSMLPVIVLGVLYLMNREYMMEFFKPESNHMFGFVPCGYLSLAIGALLIVIGYFVMNKLAEIEV
jgi:tight adherence protein B